MMSAASTVCGPDLMSRFQGCLVAAVAGDCLGAPFEVCGVGSIEKVVDFEKKLTSDSKQLQFTDDTAMARSVAQSLIDNKCTFKARDMAKRFSDEFSREGWRGYGANVIHIFNKLGDPELVDVFHPATTQFDGSGSYGNGGAMRIAPVPLAFYNDFEKMKQVAVDSTRLTHSNCLGYNGALLLSSAVYFALHQQTGTDINTDQFIDRLMDIMKDAEGVIDMKSEGEEDESKRQKLKNKVSVEPEYTTKLLKVKELLKMENAEIERVVSDLGNGIAAHRSVVTAIYCFLRSLKPIDKIPTDNGLVRTILYAISMDGDTDTIATMAGAIGGAYYGIDSIPEKWIKICEGVDHARKQAKDLFALNEK